jgi:drug/metabolite transporter (DMT)-like permease
MQIKTTSVFIAYGLSSISMTLMNKHLAVQFPYLYTTILIQNIGAILYSLSSLNLGVNKINPLLPHHVLPSLGNALWFVAMLWTSMKSLQIISVPLYVVAAYSRPLFTCLLEFLIRRRTLPKKRVLALVLVLIGSVLYSFSDSTASVYGLGYAMANTLLVAGLSVYENVIMNSMKSEQTAFGVNLYRVLFTLPFLFMLMVGSERPDFSISAWTAWLLVLSSGCGLLLGVLMFVLQPLVSATTIQLGNILFKFITTVISLVLHPVYIAPQGWVGYAVCSLGFFMYSIQNEPIPEKKTVHLEMEE